MSCHPRTRATRYTAVSYTWGDGAPTESIFINGQHFSVRSNLWSCLYYMGQDRRAGWTHLWVDAICIDQGNDQERSAQVRVMDVIYRNAFSVSVWLGLPPSAERYRVLSEPIKTFDDDDFDWFDSVQELANRPYWGRFWVIQEFLLA
ncbi:heterokaryon incompatibility, partial [Periconia macrospinosa]